MTLNGSDLAEDLCDTQLDFSVSNDSK